MDQKQKMFANITEVKAINDKDRIVEFVATKEIKDYDGDILKIEGLDISKIKKNKSFLWSHQMYMPPIGKITKIQKDGKIVTGQAQMTSEEEYPYGYTIYKLIKGGYINNVSISFIPDYATIEYKEDDKGIRTRIINDATLLEISAVNVGANNATTLEAKSIRDAANKAWGDGVLDGSELKSIEDVMKECEDISCLLEAAEKNSGSVDYKKTINELEIKIAELELQLSEKELDDIDKNDYLSQIYDEYMSNDPDEKSAEDLLNEMLNE